ncbi:RDD family protein [Rossellomorea sp. BNER]|uniref:RDD family protein n=1 Tax=Rossellomorea sp. BNER TaxID=2962031 RepID=UPI003AF27937|nr:RDD family protein [Rossellomorea sp. BNER]
MSDNNDFHEENSNILQVDDHQERHTLNDGSFFLAGFWMRFWAYLIDLIVVASIGNLLVKPIFRLLDVSIVKDGMFTPIAITGAIIFYGYFVLMTKFFGQTLGKMIFGLRVTNIKGSNLGWGTILFRELIGRFISSYMFILYAVVAFTPKKQGIHDLFADTTVIQERKMKILKPAH